MRAVLLMVLVAACKKEAAAPPAPVPAKPAAAVEAPKSIHVAVVEEAFVVVVPKGQNVEAVKAKALARVKTLGGTVVDVPLPRSGDRAMMRYTNPAITDAELDAMAKGTAFAVALKGEPIATLRAIAPIVLELATSVHGWVIDPTAAGTYTPEQFARHVPSDPIDVRTQIYVHNVGGEGDLPFLDTAGMEKLGLPELMVSAAAGGQLEEMTILVNATAQTLVAHPDIKVPGTIDVDLATLPGEWHVDEIRKNGGTARVHWLARWAAGQEHAIDGKEIELLPATGSGTEGVGRLIDECFGTQPDTVIGAKADDPELAAAAVRARKELLALRSHFAKGVPFNEQLLVNAPFTEHGKTEWMWVEVITWNGDAFQGTLANQPDHLKAVRQGSPVTVPFANVADYYHVHADGTRIGGYSDEILLKREGSR